MLNVYDEDDQDDGDEISCTGMAGFDGHGTYDGT